MIDLVSGFFAFGVFLTIVLIVLFHLYVKTDNALIGAVGYIADVVVNVVYASILFLDLPREPTVTERLRRYIVDPEYDETWRYYLAEWIADQIDRIDPGHV